MLFNDAGFVRFRLGNDPSLAQTDVLSQSSQVKYQNKKFMSSLKSIICKGMYFHEKSFPSLKRLNQ